MSAGVLRGLLTGPAGGLSMSRGVALLFALDATAVTGAAVWVLLHPGPQAPALLARAAPLLATLVASGAVALLARTRSRPRPASAPSPAPADAADGPAAEPRA